MATKKKAAKKKAVKKKAAKKAIRKALKKSALKKPKRPPKGVKKPVKKPAKKKPAAKPAKKKAVKKASKKATSGKAPRKALKKAAKATSPAKAKKAVTKTPMPAAPKGASAPVQAGPAHGGADATGSSGGFTVAAYRGDGCVMFAFNFAEKPGPDFQGFAIQCTRPSGKVTMLRNRLNFEGAVTAKTSPADSNAMQTSTAVAPIQKFHWIDFSSSHEPGKYSYKVSAMHGKPGALTAMAEVTVVLFMI